MNYPNLYRDFGHPLRQKFIHEPLRQKFIHESASLDAKREVLRQQLHSQGKYFIGEESLAKLNGGKVFDQFTGWKK